MGAFFEIIKDWSLYIPITLLFEGVLWGVADVSQVSCYALNTVDSASQTAFRANA